MPVLTIASRKGGCGKTTIATALATKLAALDYDVALLDADPNGSAHRWATTIYEGPSLASHAEPDKDRLAELLPTLANRHEIVIADTAGFGNQSATLCMFGSDSILVPVSPGEADVTEAQRTIKFIADVSRSARRVLPARVIANRLRRATMLSRHTLAEIEACELPSLRTGLSETVGFGSLSFSGELPTSGPAATEMAALLEELRELGWLPARQHAS